jgi:hypothetical protein
VIVKERLVRLALAVAILATVAFFGAIGEVFPNGLKWG